VRLELAADPICTVDDGSRFVRVLFSFDVIECDGRTIEFSWEDTEVEVGPRPWPRWNPCSSSFRTPHVSFWSKIPAGDT
jgi:hypothetical protein